MKIKKSMIKKKCESDKYHSAIKYMSHTLKGKEREDFIKMVCDINIYLGCICASTCEKNANVENYIWKRLNRYFEPQMVTYYDVNNNELKKTKKRLRSYDITNYLMACNAMENYKAIRWYIYNHEIQKSAILQLAKMMNESQLVDLIYSLFKSEKNWNKIRGVGTTKNLYLCKKDKRIESILKGLWYKDMDAFIQLASDTGWLGELGKHTKRREFIYVECLKKSNKLLLAIQLIEDALSSVEDDNVYDVLLYILKKSKNDGKEYIYLIYMLKIQSGYNMKVEDYEFVRHLPKPCEKVKNYFITFFNSMINGEYMYNIDYFEVADSFSKVLVKPNKVNARRAVARNENLHLAIKRSKELEIKKVMKLYFGTLMSAKASLDELFRLLNNIHEVQIDRFIGCLEDIPIWARVVEDKLVLCKDIVTENFISCDMNYEIGSSVIIQITDYDFIGRIFLAKPFCGNVIKLV